MYVFMYLFIFTYPTFPMLFRVENESHQQLGRIATAANQEPRAIPIF